MSAKRLGEILMGKKLITLKQLEEALSEQQSGRKELMLGKILVRKGLITEDDLMNALSEQCGISYVSLKGEYIDWNLCHKHIQAVAAEKKFFPFKETQNSVWVALSNPLDVAAMAQFEDHVRPKTIKLILVKEEELIELISKCEKEKLSGLKSLLEKEDE
ncbi:MAG: hypothetical protein ACM3L6_07540 [Deltaproteobacteria bacterium]